ncbi:hypothetical protein Tsubulata_019168 [Turnera subulata]|uniref:Uncharacterized protein n=1 Tax=Turnera subulata TaxID=218843 RepID=A0A9Q0GF51_9ROSI|nr:hypothetical protein Tsubulata_019168 [Turnera subulata]
MGNCLGGKSLVQPLDHEYGFEGKSLLTSRSSRTTRIKIRMRASRLEELMAEVDLNKGNSEDLGRMILQESLEGKFGAHVVSSHQVKVPAYAGTLCTIKEE